MINQKPFEFKLGFEKSSDLLRDGTEWRKKEREGMLSYGIPFLDDITNGISKRDLVLIGGRTGAGKTEIASIIAQHNALNGKRVHFFALEAGPREIESRITFRLLVERYYSMNLFRDEFIPLNYKDWLNGKLAHKLEYLEPEIDKIAAEKFQTLHMRYRGHEFGVEDLQKELLAIQDETDLIVLDHLHFIDSDDENENRGMKKIIQTLRNSALEIGKPVIALAHLRKGDKKEKSLIPDLEDFHGSSDVPKIATSCLMLAPAYDVITASKLTWATYMRLAKCREDGSRTRFVAQTYFNAKTNCYDPAYKLSRFPIKKDEFEQIEKKDLPHWAIGAGA